MEQRVIEMIRTIRRHQGLEDLDILASSELYDDGIGLDSLCVAELSAMLEKAFGSDPYSNKVIPRTVADIVAFYD